MRSKQVTIADITTLTKGNQLYGHFAKVALQYKAILSRTIKVVISGGKTYLHYFKGTELRVLPFIQSVDSNNKKHVKSVRKLKEIINAWIVLHSSSDVVIFQCLEETPIYVAMLFSRTKAKVVLIQYQKGLDRYPKRVLYKLIKSRISGVISSSREVVQYYAVGGLVVPDYFPVDERQYSSNKKYDIVVLGTVSNWKNYEDVITSLSGTGLKTLIAGFFPDKDYLSELEQKASKNVKIIDKYLTDSEYSNLLQSSRYACLPYKKQYIGKSSGVVLDALYERIPVITPKIDTFEMVGKFNLGIQYSCSLSEIIDKIEDPIRERTILNNVDAYIDDRRKDEQRLSEYINSLC